MAATIRLIFLGYITIFIALSHVYAQKDTDIDGIPDSRDFTDNRDVLKNLSMKVILDGKEYIGIINEVFVKKYDQETRELRRKTSPQYLNQLKQKEANNTLNTIEKADLAQFESNKQKIIEYEKKKEYILTVKVPDRNFTKEVVIEISKYFDEKSNFLDTDQDGVPDFLDACPQYLGLKNKMGCPDKDGDEVFDFEDDCPEKAGLIEFRGCPDTDKDGIRDGDDDCPKDAGYKELNGCPDKDRDGIPDKDDKCPDKRGSKENKGCPKEGATTEVPIVNYAENEPIIALSTLDDADKARLKELEQDISLRELQAQRTLNQLNIFLHKIRTKKASELTDEEIDELKYFATAFKKEIESYQNLDDNLKDKLTIIERKIQNAYSNQLVPLEKKVKKLQEEKEKLKTRVRDVFGISSAIFLILSLFLFFLLRRLKLTHQKLKNKAEDLLATRNELDSKYTELSKSKEDIERKKSMIEVLLNELHHRVRNNIVSISGMLVLELDKKEEMELRKGLSKINNRLGELELIHRKLTFVQDDQITFYVYEYIEEITDALLHLKPLAIQPKITIETHELQLMGHQTFYIGLVVYELVNNSFKYAFQQLNNILPQIYIELKKINHEEYVLIVKDNGIGMPANYFVDGEFQFKKIKSQGLKIIRLIAHINEGQFDVLSTASKNGNQQGVHFECALKL